MLIKNCLDSVSDRATIKHTTGTGSISKAAIQRLLLKNGNLHTRANKKFADVLGIWGLDSDEMPEIAADIATKVVPVPQGVVLCSGSCVRKRAGKGRWDMKVTISDIAQLAKVSKSTISRVLNNSGPVSEETRKAVLSAIADLNYRPNEVARSLSLRKTGTIGILLQDVRNPYYAHACWYADRLLEERGYSSVIANADNDPKREEDLLTSMRYRNVEGVLCVGIQEQQQIIEDFVANSDIPLVLVDREVDCVGVDSVIADNRYGGQLVVDYLLSLGHSRIAFATSAFTIAEKQRQLGYEDGLDSHGVGVDRDLIVTQSEQTWHAGECPELMRIFRRDNWPTAVFASNDLKAFHVLRALTRLGISVPEDVSVVGYDDVETASMISPALTTVHQPIDKMISSGTEILMSRIAEKGKEGQTETARQQIVMKPWLVERESTRRQRR